MSQFGHETLNVYQESIHFITKKSALPDRFDVDWIDTSQFTAKCVTKKIKIMIKIEIKKFFLQFPWCQPTA